MTRYSAIVLICCLLFILTAIPANAEDEKYPEISCTSFGFGIDWGGIGFNHVEISDGSPVGFSVGLGYIGIGVGGGAFIVARPGTAESGFFGGYAGGTVGSNDDWAEFAAGTWFVGYGNFPIDSGEFVWRLNLGMDADDEFFPWFGIGVSL